MANTKKITSIVDAQRETGDAPPEVQHIIVRQGTGWQTTALLFLSLLLLTTIGVAFYAFHRVGELNDEMGTTMRRVEEKIQNLDAGISFDSKRQQLLLGIRDEIMRTNPRVGRVGSIRESPDGTQTIHLESEVDYATLEEVLILLEPRGVEFETAANDGSRDAP